MLTTNSLIAGARALSAEISWLTLKRAIVIEYGIVVFFMYWLRGRDTGFHRQKELLTRILYSLRSFLISLISASILCFLVAWIIAAQT